MVRRQAGRVLIHDAIIYVCYYRAMQKTVLVTGGAGFVGSHLCERLVSDECHVISLDNYFTGLEANHVARVEYRDGHTKDIVKYVPEFVDEIFHLGEYSRVAPSLSEPEQVWDLNIAGTLAVAEHWRMQNRSHTCKLIYAGSSTKFTDDKRSGVMPGQNRAPYNWAKAVNTELMHNYGRWYDLPYRVAYFYNVYGPRERSGQFDGGYGTVVETFRQCYLTNKNCTINGSGEQTRAFTHVLDTVNALILIGEKGERDEYAISAREVYSLLELSDMFGLKAEFAKETKSTRSTKGGDPGKLEALGWKQEYDLKSYVELCKQTKT